MEHFLLSLTPRKTVLQYLSGLRNLHELKTGMMIQLNAFPILGELPQLKQLTLSSVFIEPVPDSITLPDDSFPALEHLILNNLRYLKVELVLSQLPLVRNIDSLEVFMSLGEGDKGWVANEFIPHLEKMTHITNLHMDFNEAKDMDGEYKDISAPAALSILAKLPLHTLDLAGVEFTNYTDFSKVFPTLTKLQIPDQYGSPMQLSTFATIPKLERLIINVYLPDDMYAFRDETPVCETLHTLEVTNIQGLQCSPKWVTWGANFLLKIFPNIKKVVGPTKTTPWGCVIEDTATVWVNSQITLLHEVNKIRGRIAKQYSKKKANSFIPESFPADVYEE